MSERKLVAHGTRPRPVEALPRTLRAFAWVSFVLNVVIIATGGAVRLTGSGLGCTDWPFCTPDSLFATPELGIHGLIEFGNRTISGPLLIAAVAVLVLSVRLRRRHRALFVLSIIVLVLVLLQAFVGGVIVWEELQAVLVGFHYTVSLVIVCLTAAYLTLMYEGAGPRDRAVPLGFAVLTHITTLVLAITVVFGVVTTASGPHSGDEDVVRNGFDATLLSHIHAWPGYALLALTLGLLSWSIARRLRPRAWLLVLLIAQAVQVAVGVYQARSGLPPFAVGVHMVLAALLSATMVVVVLRVKRPRYAPSIAESSA